MTDAVTTCPCGDNDGHWCSLPGCPYPKQNWTPVKGADLSFKSDAARFTHHEPGEFGEGATVVTSTTSTEAEAETRFAAELMDEPVNCPVCDVAFKPDDICATDIELGTCHALCLEGSPVVDLDTGDELPEGKADTYLYSKLAAPDLHKPSPGNQTITGETVRGERCELPPPPSHLDRMSVIYRTETSDGRQTHYTESHDTALQWALAGFDVAEFYQAARPLVRQNASEPLTYTNRADGKTCTVISRTDDGVVAFVWEGSKTTRYLGREEFEKRFELTAGSSHDTERPADRLRRMQVALVDIFNERMRQQEKEGWTAEHDDQHDDFSMAKAASVYAAAAAAGRADRAVMDEFGLRGTPGELQKLWPLSWDISWLKPTSRRRDLIKAAALIIAEIERLDRAALATTEGSNNG